MSLIELQKIVISLKLNEDNTSGMSTCGNQYSSLASIHKCQSFVSMPQPIINSLKILLTSSLGTGESNFADTFLGFLNLL